jgi:hypothetical protein
VTAVATRRRSHEEDVLLLDERAQVAVDPAEELAQLSVG